MNSVYRLLVWVSIIGFAASFLGCHQPSLKQVRGGVPQVVANEFKPKGSSFFELVTGYEAVEARSRWNAIFDTQHYVFGKEPAPFLKENIQFLPVGRALDIAMGEGRNAVYLAKKGFKVDGVDISEVALRKANRLAKENQVSIVTINQDLNAYRIAANSYDAIINIQYLQRSLIAQIKQGLRRGGVVVFENYTLEQLQNPSGKSLNRDALLDPDELKEIFKDFQILIYRVTNDGNEAVASLVARRP